MIYFALRFSISIKLFVPRSVIYNKFHVSSDSFDRTIVHNQSIYYGRSDRPVVVLVCGIPSVNPIQTRYATLSLNAEYQNTNIVGVLNEKRGVKLCECLCCKRFKQGFPEAILRDHALYYSGLRFSRVAHEAAPKQKSS